MSAVMIAPVTSIRPSSDPNAVSSLVSVERLVLPAELKVGAC